MEHLTTNTFARRLALIAFLCASLAFAACGGGGGGDDDNNGNGNDDPINEDPINEDPVVTTIQIVSTPELDGVVFGDNNGDTSRSDLQCAVGDGPFVTGAGSSVFVSYYSFDLTQIPAGATVQSATLSLFNRQIQGNPEAAMALVRVDHVNFGTLFPQVRLGATGLDFAFAQIDDLNVTGRKNLDATTQVLDDIADGRPRSQFRLRGAIASNNDNAADVMLLTDGEDSQGSGELPLLILQIVQ